MILTAGAALQIKEYNKWFLVNRHARFLAVFDFVTLKEIAVRCCILNRFPFFFNHQNDRCSDCGTVFIHTSSVGLVMEIMVTITLVKKYIDNYWMDYHEIGYRCPQCLMTSYSVICRSNFHFSWVSSQHLLHCGHKNSSLTFTLSPPSVCLDGCITERPAWL